MSFASVKGGVSWTSLQPACLTEALGFEYTEHIQPVETSSQDFKLRALEKFIVRPLEMTG